MTAAVIISHIITLFTRHVSLGAVVQILFTDKAGCQDNQRRTS